MCLMRRLHRRHPLRGQVGGTDLGGAQAVPSLRTDHKAARHWVIYPGHNVGVAPVSTVAHERETNPFLLQPDFEAFVHLKANWAAYKAEHGIK